MAPESTAADAGQDTRKFGIPPDRGALTFINRDPPRIVKTEGFERLFSHYTGLLGEELLQYLQEFQAKALKIYPYACISNGGFAALRERAHYEYPQVLEYAKMGRHIVVDLGCCMGTDIREFILDGGDAGGSNRIIGIDLQQEFLDLGQQLFKGPTPGLELRAANLLDPSDTTVDDLKGKVTLLYTGAVFHLFHEPEQRLFAEKIYSLFSKTGEVTAFGTHRGQKEPGVRKHPAMGLSSFAHSPESWKEMWRDILGEDAVNWRINAELKNSWTNAEQVDETRQVLQWSLWRKDL